MSRQSQGFTLVEALISVLIMSIGLLGVAALQTRSLGSSHTASQRSQAILAAGDIADRIRANRVAGSTTAGANYSNIAAADNSCRAAHYSDAHGLVADCTPVQLAADDLSDWNAHIGAVLPTGTGVVCIDSTPNDGTAGAPACDGVGNVYAIKIFWTEKSDNSTASTGAVNQRFVTEMQP
jgi:type IV pilus assembly protein PilV